MVDSLTMQTRSVWPVVRLITIYGGCYVVLMYFGGFSWVHNAVLALVLTDVLDRSFAELFRPTPFRPFSLTITPQWHDILFCQGLVDEQQWKALGERHKEMHSSESPNYCLLRDGITITVLGQGLYYFNDMHGFQTSLNSHWPIEELRSDDVLGYTPSLYIKERLMTFPGAGRKPQILAVVELGLVTPDSLKNSTAEWDDRCDIPLGHLPTLALRAETQFESAMDIGAAGLRSLYERTGWKEEEAVFGSVRSHKYFRIRYRSI
ncbi:MAG: hypothetical protein IT158_12270 [Bryobacterales bacterium]|nr:hypothetical protein [Bryobacterales bacterium]